MKISTYKPEHEDAVLAAILKEPDWDIFTNKQARNLYTIALQKSITYVCHDCSEFCGYVRAIPDPGFSIYISELYVAPKWRNLRIGQSLLMRIKEDFSNLTVYALSDEDAYYEKIGCKKVGSVYEL
jgi:ribosomal protein S18 acetylase RimI-like enzyme